MPNKQYLVFVCQPDSKFNVQILFDQFVTTLRSLERGSSGSTSAALDNVPLFWVNFVPHFFYLSQCIMVFQVEI